jgi:diguanylate cyclase (GGDEF)-like protein
MAFRLDPATLMFATSALAFLSAGFSFITAKGLPHEFRCAREWGWAMTALGAACFLWFLGPHAHSIFAFFFGNSLVVLAGIFVLRAFLGLCGRSLPTGLGLGLLLMGMSGIIACYDFGAPRWVTVLSIAASHITMVSMSCVALAQSRASLPAPYRELLFTVLLLLGATIVWRCAVALFGQGAPAVTPVAASDAQVSAIAAASLLIAAGSFGFFGIVSSRQRQQLLETARRDGLTGLYTRNAFFDLARNALSRGDGGCALLMIDLDHFKEINDTHGHAAGDAVIRHAARLVQQLIRSQDIAGRYGGEEFCVLLPGCGSEAARGIAERIITEAASQSVRLPNGETLSYTTSLGYVAHDPGAHGASAAPSLEELLQCADVALYSAKRRGRNRAHAGVREHVASMSALQAVSHCEC